MKTLALAALAVLISLPAHALECGSPVEVLTHLKDKYGEVPAYIGTTAIC